MVKSAVLVLISVLAFAANSVLARLALGSDEINALSYTGLRLLSGALMLAAIVCFRERKISVPYLLAGGSICVSDAQPTRCRFEPRRDTRIWSRSAC